MLSTRNSLYLFLFTLSTQRNLFVNTLIILTLILSEIIFIFVGSILKFPFTLSVITGSNLKRL